MRRDEVIGKAIGRNGDKYVVLQVILREKLNGTGSNDKSITLLQSTINEQANRGYRLHSFSTVASGSKGPFGGDRIQATMVFEQIE